MVHKFPAFSKQHLHLFQTFSLFHTYSRPSPYFIPILFPWKQISIFPDFTLPIISVLSSPPPEENLCSFPRLISRSCPGITGFLGSRIKERGREATWPPLKWHQTPKQAKQSSGPAPPGWTGTKKGQAAPLFLQILINPLIFPNFHTSLWLFRM